MEGTAFLLEKIPAAFRKVKKAAGKGAKGGLGAVAVAATVAAAKSMFQVEGPTRETGSGPESIRYRVSYNMLVLFMPVVVVSEVYVCDPATGLITHLEQCRGAGAALAG